MIRFSPGWLIQSNYRSALPQLEIVVQEVFERLLTQLNNLVSIAEDVVPVTTARLHQRPKHIIVNLTDLVVLQTDWALPVWIWTVEITAAESGQRVVP